MIGQIFRFPTGVEGAGVRKVLLILLAQVLEFV